MVKAIWFNLRGRLLCLLGKHDGEQSGPIPWHLLQCTRCKKLFFA